MSGVGAAAALAVAKGIMDTAGPVINTAVGAGVSRRNFKDTVKLANTAHQREVQDLIKAGLNPILSAGGSGAQSPMAAMPAIDVKPGSSSAPTDIMDAKKRGKLLKIEIDTASANEAKAQADAAKAVYEKELTEKEKNARGLILAAQLQNLQLQAKNTSALTEKLKNEAVGIGYDNAERKQGANIYNMKVTGTLYKAIKELFK